MEALRAAAAAAYYGDDAVMRRLGYDAAERVRRGGELRAAKATPPEPAPPAAVSPAGGVVDLSGFSGRRTVHADVAVIGSGAGGAVVAKELAEAGACVVIVEEGVAHDVAEFTARPRDMLPRLYRDAAQHATLGRPPILLPLGKGGRGDDARELGDLLPHARPRARSLARGVRPRGLTPDLAPHFERVEREINVVERAAGAGRRQRARRPPRGRGARVVGRVRQAQRPRVRGLRRLRLRVPDGRQAARRRDVHARRPTQAGATTYTGVTVRRINGRVEGTTAARRHARGARGPRRRRRRRASTRPRCSPATGSATTASAATSPSTPPPRRSP